MGTGYCTAGIVAGIGVGLNVAAIQEWGARATASVLSKLSDRASQQR